VSQDCPFHEQFVRKTTHRGTKGERKGERERRMRTFFFKWQRRKLDMGKKVKVNLEGKQRASGEKQ